MLSASLSFRASPSRRSDSISPTSAVTGTAVNKHTNTHKMYCSLHLHVCEFVVKKMFLRNITMQNLILYVLYHPVNESESNLCISPSLFQGQARLCVSRDSGWGGSCLRGSHWRHSVQPGGRLLLLEPGSDLESGKAT